MNEITLKYRPRFSIREKTITISHPGSWAELSPAQLIAAASVLNGTVTDDRVIYLMTRIPKRIISRLSPYQKLSVIELLRFLNDYTPYHQFIIPNIGILHSPKPRLKDESFGTFIFAETYFSKYEKTYEIEDLDRFVACYYREGPFEENHIQVNATLLKNESEIKKHAIYVNYILIRQFLALNYPNLFSPAQEGNPDPSSSWVDVFDAVVGDDIVKQAQYAKLPLSTVLRFLDKSIKKNRSK
jgi:hypothetical protein